MREGKSPQTLQQLETGALSAYHGFPQDTVFVWDCELQIGKISMRQLVPKHIAQKWAGIEDDKPLANSDKVLLKKLKMLIAFIAT